MLITALFNSFTLSAYPKVLSACSTFALAGEMFAIIVVLLFLINESLRTYVSFDPLNGVCFFDKSKALIHSFSAKSDLFISAPSICVCLSVFIVSAPLSLPAKSIKLILLYSRLLCFRLRVRMACDRELSAFAPVDPLALSSSPFDKAVMISWTEVTFYSVRLIMLTCYFASSLQKTASRLFNKSKSFPQ